MKRLLRLLWTGQWALPAPCEHHWKIIKSYSVSAYGREQKDEYDLQCQKCGDIKTTKGV